MGQIFDPFHMVNHCILQSGWIVDLFNLMLLSPHSDNWITWSSEQGNEHN